MARKRKEIDPNKINQIASFVSDNTEENIDAPKGRSKRGIAAKDTSQICFRIEKARHKAVKIYCMENDLEVGEFMDNLLAEKGL